MSHHVIFCWLSLNGLNGRQPKKTTAKANHNLKKKARLEFAKIHIDMSQCLWENVLRRDETKLELFVNTSHLFYVDRDNNETYKDKNTLRPGGGSVMFCGRFCAVDNEISRLSRRSRAKEVLPIVRKYCVSCRSYGSSEQNTQLKMIQTGREQNVGLFRSGLTHDLNSVEHLWKEMNLEKTTFKPETAGVFYSQGAGQTVNQCKSLKDCSITVIV